VAGGAPWGAIMRISTEDKSSSTAYTNICNNVITTASTASENGKVVGIFTVGGRYDTSIILSNRPFLVSATN